MTASEIGECCRHCMRNDLVVFEDFPEVTFENSPMEVELKLIEK